MVPRPAWLAAFERRIAGPIAVHPNAISAAKLLLVTPLLLASLRQVDALPGGAFVVSACFAAFGALDYLDGVVARERGLETSFGRVLDRVTDYPLLIALSYYCVDVIPLPLLAAKLLIDLLLLALFALGFGSTQNRLRTMLSYTTLFSLLSLSQGWLTGLFRVETVSALLYANLGFSALVVLHNLGITGRASPRWWRWSRSRSLCRW